MGERYAKENGIEILLLLPDWKKYGRKAGIMRNSDIVDAADHILCFWDGNSKGTKDTIDKVRKSRVRKILEINYYTRVKYK